MTNGQGYPLSIHSARTPSSGFRVRRWCWLIALVLVLRASTVAAQSPVDVRLRIAWGGGAARSWTGTISVSEGEISELKSLGIEPDQPGSIWNVSGRVHIRPRTPRSYDGVDMTVRAPKTASVRVELQDASGAAGDSSSKKAIEIPLEKLTRELHNAALDDRGNWLLARRAPGDELRVTVAPNRVLLKPRERFTLTVQPHLLPVKPDTAVRLTATWVTGRNGSEVRSDNSDQKAGPDGVVPPSTFAVEAPDSEGVYTIKLTASHRPTLGWRQTLATRNIQVVVLDPAAAATAPAPRIKLASKRILEIDRANPKWWERFAELSRVPAIPGLSSDKLPKLPAPRIPGISARPLGSGHVSKYKHAAGALSALAPGGWEAYPLAGCEPGKPHELIVEYPADVPQQLSISVVEPNAAGAVVPIGMDSGVYVTEGLRVAKPVLAEHRIVFWPRTKQPYVLLAARESSRAAVFGKIRVVNSGGRLSWLKPEARRDERMVAGYYNRPLFPENFSAAETLDDWSGRSLDDWQTFYKGGGRLVEYMGHAGYNTLFLAVNSEGGTIYPSRLLQPTPKYDTGAFFSTGQDPLQKDVLGMLFEMFNRQQFRLVPVVQFGAPLPEIDAVVRRGGAPSVGIEWVGADGRTWLETNPTRRKLGPYYNVLHPHVQRSMLAVIQEIASRYQHHPAYAGMAVELSAYSYAQLPGPDWGFDDFTISQFTADTRIKVPGEGPRRFATRARFLLSDDYRMKWIEWRATRLARFHQQIAKAVAATRHNARLYLTGTDMFEADDVRARLRPALPATQPVAAELKAVGIVPSVYASDERIEFVKPYPISLPLGPVGDAVDQRVRDWTATAKQDTPKASPTAVFYHRPAQLFVAGLAEQGPWGKNKTKPWIVSQMSPSGVDNRKRFVRMLAQTDAQSLIDGGWLLNLGQEESVADLIRVFRELPAARFETVRGDSDPVTVRVYSRAGQTFAYLVNDSPWDLSATLQVRAPAGCQAISLAASRRLPPLAGAWTLDMKPYDVIGVRFNADDVALSGAKVRFHADVEKILRERIAQLTRQAAALRWPRTLKSLANADFEKAAGGVQFAGWQATDRDKGALRVESRLAHGGTKSAVLSSDGPVQSLRSDVIPTPDTGRISVSVWLRVCRRGPSGSFAAGDRGQALRPAVLSLRRGWRGARGRTDQDRVESIHFSGRRSA